VDARRGARTMLHIMGCGGGRECVGVRLLVVIMTSSGEHLAQLWLAGFLGLSSAKGANGLLLCVTY
jgi:hypothetical protein